MEPKALELHKKLLNSLKFCHVFVVPGGYSFQINTKEKKPYFKFVPFGASQEELDTVYRVILEAAGTSFFKEEVEKKGSGKRRGRKPKSKSKDSGSGTKK